MLFLVFLNLIYVYIRRNTQFQVKFKILCDLYTSLFHFFQPTVEKERISKEILESFDSSSFLAVYHYNDINCNDWRRIRSKLRKNDIKLRVVPVKLTSRV